MSDPETDDAGDSEIAEHWRAFFQSALEALPVGVLLVNRATYIISVNRAFERLFERSRADVETQKLDAVMPEALIKEFNLVERVVNIANSESADDSFEAGLKIQGQDKILQCMLRSGQSSNQATGGAPVIVLVFKDVTHERLLQQQLAQSGKMASIGQIAGGVAHEINTPLASILFNVQLLQTMAVTEDIKAVLKSVESSTSRCKDIVQMLMSYVRPTQVGVRLSPIRLVPVVEESMTLMGSLLQADNVKVVRDIRADPTVRGHATEISQILVNFLSNAKDAVSTRPLKEIHVRLYTEKEHAVLEVEDNGEGIAAADAARVFEPFFTTKGVGKGTGLGLAVSKSIADRHAGVLALKSKQGQGSIFSFRLPLMRS
jgi:PAS domain S-box-containing protein